MGLAYLDKLSERPIRALLLLKLIFSVQLMRAVGDERSEMGHRIQKNVANALDDRVLLLSLVQRVTQASVHSYDIVYIPEDLFQEVCPPGFGYDVPLSQGLDPQL